MKNYDEHYNLGNVSDEVKNVIEDVIFYILHNKEEKTSDEIAEGLKIRYNIENIPMMKTSDSILHEMLKDIDDVNYHVVGTTEKQINGKKIRIPYINISGDLIDIDNCLGKFREKILELESKKQN